MSQEGDNKVPILRPCPPTGAANEVLQLIGNKFCEDPPITVHPGQLATPWSCCQKAKQLDTC